LNEILKKKWKWDKYIQDQWNYS